MVVQSSKRTKKLSKCNIYWWILAISQFLLVLCCFSVLPQPDYVGCHYNTDFLYLPSLYTDLFEDGGRVNSWYLTPSPYFFPDMVLYFPIYAIFKNIGISAIVYGLVQLWLIEFFFFKILAEWTDRVNSQRYFLYSFAALNLILVTGVCAGEYFIAHLLLSCSAHVGAVLCSVITLYLYIKYTKTLYNRWLMGLSFLILISILSDRIFIVQTCIPLLIVSGYDALKKKSWKPVLVILISSVAGFVFFKLIREFVTFIPEDLSTGVTTVLSIKNFLDDMRLIHRANPITGFILYFCLIILGLLPFGVWLIPKEKRSVYFLLMLGCFTSILAPLVLGFISGIDTFRYIIHSFIYLLLIIPVFFALMIRSKFLQPSSWILSFVILGIVLLISGLKLKREELNRFVNYKSSYVKLVESNQSRLKNGISDYWHTKEVYLMGGRKSRVVPLYPVELIPYKWQINKKWFTGKSEPPVFNFSINLRADRILGPPIDSIYGPKDTIFIYNDFIFLNTSKHDIRMFPLTAELQ